MLLQILYCFYKKSVCYCTKVSIGPLFPASPFCVCFTVFYILNRQVDLQNRLAGSLFIGCVCRCGCSSALSPLDGAAMFCYRCFCVAGHTGSSRGVDMSVLFDWLSCFFSWFISLWRRKTTNQITGEFVLKLQLDSFLFRGTCTSLFRALSTPPHFVDKLSSFCSTSCML